MTANSPVQPGARALAEPALQSLEIVAERVGDLPQPKARQLFLKAGAHTGEIGQRESAEEFLLRSGGHGHDAPSPSTPARGLALPAASFATSLDVPPPIETDSLVASCTSLRIRRAVSANGSCL